MPRASSVTPPGASVSLDVAAIAGALIAPAQDVSPLRGWSSLRAGLVALSLLAATACASVRGPHLAMRVVRPGHPAARAPVESGLVVSGRELEDYASEHFGLIEVTFENTTAEWVRVERLALDFGDPERNAGVVLPMGADLDAWQQATLQRNHIRGTNAGTALAALLALGTVVAVAGAATGERELAAAGAAVTLGAAAADTLLEHDARVAQAEDARLLPEAHLLAVPFAVPPGLFAKKWVLLNTRNRDTPCIVSMLIDYDVERGNEQMLLVFRRPFRSSEWQPDACRRSPRRRGGIASPRRPGR